MSVEELAERLGDVLPGRVTTGSPLDRFTTYRLGGLAAVLVEIADERELMTLAEALRDHAVDVLVIGRGSNLVISDSGWPGVVVHLGKAFTNILETDEGARAGGAASLPVVANWCARRGLGGFEFAIAIPGSIGGAVRMNAGAHGREMIDALARVRVVDLAGGIAEDRPAEALDLSYRHSNLRDTDVVVHADLRLERGSPAPVKELMESYRRHRAETQPGAAQNAGSVFRNPPGDHAGRLVEAAGLKGFRVGGAEVSQLHANFFIAERGASAQDVYDLVWEVRSRVRERFGIDLTPEIRFVGRFQERVAGAGR